MNKKVVAIFKTLLPMIISAAICMMIFALKGIYPFGEFRIDTYDMGQTNAPLYYHIWDFLHRKSPLMFDWYINQSQNLSMASAIQWNISPFNLFFLFVRRDMVLQSLSLFTTLRVSFMALSMYILLQRMFEKLSYQIMVVFSLLYAFSGYVLQHYTITTYLDMGVFMPILLLSLFYLLKEGNKLFYILILGYSIALSYYLGYMNLIYIFMISGAYILYGCKKEERAKKSFDLAVSTIAGMGLSCIVLIPSALQMVKSSRFNSNTSNGLAAMIKEIYTSYGADMYYAKWLMLLGMALPIAIILVGCWQNRKNLRVSILSLVFVAVPGLLIPIESINIIWHMGTYYHYPIRCGYLIPLTILVVSAYYSQSLLAIENKKISSMLYLISVVIGIAIAAVLIKLYICHDIWDIRDLFKIYMVMFGVLLFVYGLIIAVFRKKIVLRAAIFALITAEILTCAYTSFGMPHFVTGYSEDPEQSGDYIVYAEKIKKDMNIEESEIDRIKNPDTELNANYSLVLRRATVTGWANTIPDEQMEAAAKYGYSRHFMRILDAGGSYFTDSLLNIKDVIAKVPLDDSFVYDRIEDDGEFIHYANSLPLPFGMIVSDELAKLDISKMDIVQLHNEIYCNLSGDNTEIAKKIDISENDNVFECVGRKALYIKGGKFDALYANDKKVPIPGIGQIDNTAYPIEFNSSLVHVGDYADESIRLKFELGDEGKLPSTAFLLDIDKLAELSKKYSDYTTNPIIKGRSMRITIDNANEGEYVLLPINYDTGMQFAINGKVVDAHRALGLFTVVRLVDGRNEISMTFVPDGLRVGIIISIFTLIIVAIVETVERRKKEKVYNAFVGKASVAIIAVSWCFAGLVIYIIPIVIYLGHQIVKRL